MEVVGADPTYMTGEHTAVLESLEGNDRIETRHRPPTRRRGGCSSGRRSCTRPERSRRSSGPSTDTDGVADDD